MENFIIKVGISQSDMDLFNIKNFMVVFEL